MCIKKNMLLNKFAQKENKDSNSSNYIEVNGEIIFNTKAIDDTLNKCFADVGSKLVSKIKKQTKRSAAEIQRILSDMTNKAGDEDGISTKVLKTIINFVKMYLVYVLSGV